MTSVTVDVDDLETLVVATGVIKSVEAALALGEADPFVRTALPRFTAAHERLATEMRNAKRATAGTLVGWDDPLAEGEVKALACIEELTAFAIDARDRVTKEGRMGVWDELAAKGCVQIGQYVSGVLWAGAPSPELQTDPQFVVRITPRGRMKLVDAKAKQETV